MRIIAGKAKGRRLKTPKGLPVRPTTELVRGAIFSILESLVDEWSKVLDLYAGSGALGMEALSRGAGWVDFVEQDHRCCELIRDNLEITGFSGQARVYCSRAEEALGFLDRQYNIVFMDPPYAEPIIDRLLPKLVTSRLLAAGSVVAIPHTARLPLSPRHGDLQLVKERRHGDTTISVYQKEEAEP